MDAWPVGLSTGCFHQQSILSCLETIKQDGFDLIEVCSVPSHLDYHNVEVIRDARTRIRELDMQTHSFHAPFAPAIDITSPDDSVRSNALEEISVAAEAAASLEATYFVIHPGPEHELIEDERQHIERLKHMTEDLVNNSLKTCSEKPSQSYGWRSMRNLQMAIALAIFCHPVLASDAPTTTAENVRTQTIRIGHFPNITHAQALITRALKGTLDFKPGAKLLGADEVAELTS
jgi:hypothetical protein